ncbi:hypothetical protein [Hungatella hathewayi]|uniref:hypothetical protein n=1 Tax=Hungatella hathewayi TaxID=154046 RepID=UPI00356495EF
MKKKYRNEKNEKDIQRRIHLVTQIDATPIIKGEQAKSILNQTEQKTNEAAKSGAKNICLRKINYFKLLCMLHSR